MQQRVQRVLHPDLALLHVRLSHLAIALRKDIDLVGDLLGPRVAGKCLDEGEGGLLVRLGQLILRVIHHGERLVERAALLVDDGRHLDTSRVLHSTAEGAAGVLVVDVGVAQVGDRLIHCVAERGSEEEEHCWGGVRSSRPGAKLLSACPVVRPCGDVARGCRRFMSVVYFFLSV